MASNSNSKGSAMNTTVVRRHSTDQTQRFKHLTTEEEELIRHMFEYHDKDRDGALTSAQVRERNRERPCLYIRNR